MNMLNPIDYDLHICDLTKTLTLTLDSKKKKKRIIFADEKTYLAACQELFGIQRSYLLWFHQSPPHLG